MAIYVAEAVGSMKGKRGKSVVRRWLVTGTADYFAVESAVAAAAPLMFGPYPRKGDFDIEPHHDADPEDVDNFTWVATVTYELSEPDDEEQQDQGDDEFGRRFSFDTSGGTRHIDEGFHLVDKQPNDAEDMGLAINVQGDDQNLVVQGADVITGAGLYTLYAVVPTVTPSMFKLWTSMSGRTNHATWKEFGAHEVLFLNASGSGRLGRAVDVAFNFQVDSSDPELPVAGETVNYEAHSNVSVRYAKKAGAKQIIPEVAGVYVVRQYQTADFSILPV